MCSVPGSAFQRRLPNHLIGCDPWTIVINHRPPSMHLNETEGVLFIEEINEVVAIIIQLHLRNAVVFESKRMRWQRMQSFMECLIHLLRTLKVCGIMKILLANI